VSGWPVTVTRQDIADALSTVEGVTGSALPPSVPNPGAGWPQAVADGRIRLNDHAAQASFWCWVVLPATGQAAELAYDALVWQVEDALGYLGEIVSAGPYPLPLGPGQGDTVPALRVTLHVTQRKG
jgi:hypothetical protein